MGSGLEMHNLVGLDLEMHNLVGSGPVARRYPHPGRHAGLGMGHRYQVIAGRSGIGLEII